MQAIKVENLSKTFRIKRKEKGMRGSVKAIFHPQTEEIRAVDGVSFTVEEGEMLAFIGPNGAGKSTTINTLCTILGQTSGRLGINGHDVSKERALVRGDIGTFFLVLCVCRFNRADFSTIKIAARMQGGGAPAR